MALVTTAGSSSANSFITVAQADTYLAASPYDTTAWDALSDSEKENLLILAGIEMNNLAWRWWPIYTNQAMCWPRWETDEDDTDIPDNIKKAQAYIAYDVIWRGLQGGLTPSEGAGTDAITRLALFGELTVSFGDSASSLAQGWPLTDLCHLLISQWVTRIKYTGQSSGTAPDLEDEIA